MNVFYCNSCSDKSYFQKKRNSADESTVSNDEDTTWKNVLVVAWTGTRGVISLAAALALPLFLDDGSAFPKRNSIIFFAFVVIFVTLVVQGLSLPLLIRWLKIKPTDNTDAEEKELQLYLATNTLNFLEQEFPIQLEGKVHDQLKKKIEIQIQNLTKEVRRHKKAKRNNEELQAAQPDEMLNAYSEINKFKRGLLLKLHKEGEFSDEAIRQSERDLDIDDLKLNQLLPNETK